MTGYQRMRFAQPLKDMLAAFGLTPAQIDGDEKELPIPGLEPLTPRLLMQTLGTEWGRKTVDPDLWVKHMRVRLKSTLKQTSVVIDDVRFENEASAIRGLGGTVVHIGGRRSVLDSHPSEDGIKFRQDLGDIMIINDGTEAEFRAAVMQLVPKIYEANSAEAKGKAVRVAIDGEYTPLNLIRACPSDGWVDVLNEDGTSKRIKGDIKLEVFDESAWHVLP